MPRSGYASPAVLRLNRTATGIARGLAVMGGIILCFAAMVMTLSIVTRTLFSTQIRGDFEIISVSSGLAILVFFPYCQATRSHITIELFSDWLPKPVRRGLDGLWSLILAAAAAAVAWRVGIGVTEAWRDYTTTMLQIPLVIVFIAALIATIGTALLAAIDAVLLLSAGKGDGERDPDTIGLS